MKGLILALLWFVLFLAAAVFLLRLRRRIKPFKVFLALFGATIPPYVYFYHVTPPDLCFLPKGLIEPCAMADFLYGLGVYALLFHNFWDFIYAGPMGFSAGLMVELEHSGGLGLSTDTIIACFESEGGGDKIFGRRMPNLLRGGYIVMNGDRVRLTRKGRGIAAVTLFLKKLICAGEGG